VSRRAVAAIEHVPRCPATAGRASARRTRHRAPVVNDDRLEGCTVREVTRASAVSKLAAGCPTRCGEDGSQATPDATPSHSAGMRARLRYGSAAPIRVADPARLSARSSTGDTAAGSTQIRLLQAGARTAMRRTTSRLSPRRPRGAASRAARQAGRHSLSLPCYPIAHAPCAARIPRCRCGWPVPARHQSAFARECPRPGTHRCRPARVTEGHDERRRTLVVPTAREDLDRMHRSSRHY